MTPEVIGNCTLYNADCLDLIPHLDFDCIITDLPYGLGDKWSGGGWFSDKTNKHTCNTVLNKASDLSWDEEANQEWMDAIIETGVPSVVWGGHYYLAPPSQCWLLWKKNTPPTMAAAEMAWTNLEKPTQMFNHPCNGWERNHPTQKPIKLGLWCIDQIKTEGVILDPFAGSGWMGACAALKNRPSILIEKSPEQFDKMCKFVEESFACSGKHTIKQPKGLLY